MAILLEMREGTLRRIDGQVGEVWPAKPFQLGVEIGEVPALQQRIIAEVDARRHVLGHEGDLLGLGEEVVGHAVKHQPSDRLRLQYFLGDDLCRVEDVEVEAVGKVLVEQLYLQFPFREVAGEWPARGRGGGNRDRHR